MAARSPGRSTCLWRSQACHAAQSLVIREPDRAIWRLMNVGVTGGQSFPVFGGLKSGVAARQKQKRAGPSLHPQRALAVEKNPRRETTRISAFRSNLLAYRPAQMKEARGGLHPQRSIAVLNQRSLLPGRRTAPVGKGAEPSVLPEEKPRSLSCQPEPPEDDRNTESISLSRTAPRVTSSTDWKRTPSKRSTPFDVVSHRYPSEDCLISKTAPRPFQSV